MAGSVIPASLVTGLSSDLPGLVVAQVTENVRDSVTGTRVLIPQGARLIGSYDNSLRYGQSRVLLTWSRLLLPDGSSIELGKMPAADASGYSGLRDRVNSHGWQLMKGALLASLIGVGSELSLGGDGLARAVREALQQNGSRAGEQIVGRALDIQPTLTVRPGWPVRVLVTRDLHLAPWDAGQ
jgi:type IV secretion system protein VirB10